MYVFFSRVAGLKLSDVNMTAKYSFAILYYLTDLFYSSSNQQYITWKVCFMISFVMHLHCRTKTAENQRNQQI